MNKKDKVDFARRHALKILGAATLAPVFKNPVAHLMDSMVKGLIHEARAVTGGKAPRNLVVFYLPGGAPRWSFDQIHDPYVTGISNAGNLQVVNGMSGGNSTMLKVPIGFSGGRTLYLPPIWNSNLPVASGGFVPMSNVLNNAMIIQGVNMLADGHSGNAAALVQPNSSAPSYGGFVADASESSVPSIALPYGQYSYRAPSGGGITPIFGFSNPLGNLLSPFEQQSTNSGFLSRRAAMDLAMKSALQKLGQFAGSSDPAALALFSSQNKAENLLKSSLGDLSGSYSTLFTKYQSLMRLAIDQSKAGVAGVTNSAIAASNFSAAHRKYQIPGGALIAATQTDLRDLITATTFVDGLAENFAITEYMITNGYSQYVSAGYGDLQALEPVSGGGLVASTSDEHDVGSIVSLIVNTARYRAFYACMNEFISVLKTKNLWSNSVILYGSEFNRAPRSDASGSDHGWQANVYTILSGAIDGPYMVGNTVGASGLPGSTLVGSEKVILTRGYVASTVAVATRIDSPNPNNAPFLVEDVSGNLQLAGVELSKAVA
jgi:hypothetical protein